MTNTIKYEVAVTELKTLRDGADNNIWRMAEIAMAIEPKYGDGTLQRLATDVGLAHTTLQHYRTTVEAWPELCGRPHFSVAYVLNSHDDRIALIAQKPDMTRREATKIIRALRGDAAKPDKSKPGIVDKKEKKRTAQYIRDLKTQLAESQHSHKALMAQFHHAAIEATDSNRRLQDRIDDPVGTFNTLWANAPDDVRAEIRKVISGKPRLVGAA